MYRVVQCESLTSRRVMSCRSSGRVLRLTTVSRILFHNIAPKLLLSLSTLFSHAFHSLLSWDRPTASAVSFSNIPVSLTNRAAATTAIRSGRHFPLSRCTRRSHPPSKDIPPVHLPSTFHIFLVLLPSAGISAKTGQESLVLFRIYTF